MSIISMWNYYIIDIMGKNGFNIQQGSIMPIEAVKLLNIFPNGYQISKRRAILPIQAIL